MAVYRVFGHPIYKHYKTSICSKATVFQIIITLLTIIIPFLIAYRSEGFWKKIDVFIEQPEVHFKHKFLLIVETVDKTSGTLHSIPWIWSSFSNLNEIMKDNLRIATITNREVDVNQDGLYDKLELSVEMPVHTQENVHSVKLLLFFDYKLSTYEVVQLEGLAYIHHTSPIPGAALTVSGELKFQQTDPLKHRGRDIRYNASIVDFTSISPEAYDLSKILASYIERKYRTTLENYFPVWKSNRITNEPFRIEANILYAQQTVLYRPGFWQLIKWGWVQYVSILLIFMYIFDQVKAFVFNNQLIHTIVEYPLKFYRK